MTTTATEMLTLYIEAEKAVLEGKEFMMNGRRVAREDLVQIRAGRQEWQRKAQQEATREQANQSKSNSVASWN